MADIHSYIFDFTSTPRFFDNWNQKFKLLDMSGGALKFKFKFSTYSSDNINDCLNGDALSDDVAVAQTVSCALKWDSNTRIISLDSDVIWNLGSDIVPLKSVFITNQDESCVLGYSINMNAFEVTNQVKVEKGSILWSIEDING